ncbi:unnamed protein product [Bemisia tabaci]|uniref:Cytochrome-b5 reductase n=1 Tax=Bemisia tabaci TaxID=7038 RepID=A0A9P0AJX4_BEMTA|nr:unnamed protein product [Bemisia tabaci]
MGDSLKPSSSGSATGNPRNKAALKPGCSLMDWIRLGNSGVDLTGVNGVRRTVSKKELARHNKRNDAWLAIRGKVYNVTRYMEFHPGGEEELMRGVGIDATKLFNDVHAWVNYESLLQKCIVGSLGEADTEGAFIVPRTKSSSKLSAASGQNPAKKLIEQTRNISIATNAVWSSSDWFQQLTFICLIFYLKATVMQLHISLTEDSNLILKLNQALHNVKLESTVRWPCKVKLNPTVGKVELEFRKVESALWRTFGVLMKNVPSEIVSSSWKMTVIKSDSITHDTKILVLKYVDCVYNYVPVGCHVMFEAVIDGKVVERPYTPVVSVHPEYPVESSIECLNFMIKSYDNGLLSKWLCSLPTGAVVSVSAPLCVFNPSLLNGRKKLVILAAGTGITPMFSVINWAVHTSSQRLSVSVIFFNKSECDILWGEQLNKLMIDNERFKVENVLSNGSSSWTGKRGRISVEIVQSELPDRQNSGEDNPFTLICGPVNFNQTAESILQKLGYQHEDYYCFH